MKPYFRVYFCRDDDNKETARCTRFNADISMSWRNIVMYRILRGHIRTITWLGRRNVETMLCRDFEWVDGTGYQRKRRFLSYCRALWTILAGGNKASGWESHGDTTIEEAESEEVNRKRRGQMSNRPRVLRWRCGRRSAIMWYWKGRTSGVNKSGRWDNRYRWPCD